MLEFIEYYIVYVGVTLLWSVPTGIIYFAYYLISKKARKNGKLTRRLHISITVSFIAILLFYSFLKTYEAFNPKDDFYISEYKDITLRDFPKSAKILKKASSYPDFHGDYSSCARIKIDKKEFDNLIYSLKKDIRFDILDGYIGSGTLDSVMNRKNIDFLIIFSRPDSLPDYSRTIIFLKNGQIITLKYVS